MGGQIKLFKQHGYTVGQLKKFIEEYQIPDDAVIVYQRIEDFYFEQNNWTTLKKKGEGYYRLEKHNEDADSGKWFDRENYPNITDDLLESLQKKFTPEEMEHYKEQYIQVHSAVYYRDEDSSDYLYLDAHY
jgi:hypothetical protein